MALLATLTALVIFLAIRAFRPHRYSLRRQAELEGRVLALLSAPRRLEDLARELGVGELEVAAILHGLMREGLVRVLERGGEVYYVWSGSKG